MSYSAKLQTKLKSLGDTANKRDKLKEELLVNNKSNKELVIFDRRPEYRKKPWAERLGWEECRAADGNLVTVVWC